MVPPPVATVIARLEVKSPPAFSVPPPNVSAPEELPSAESLEMMSVPPLRLVPPV